MAKEINDRMRDPESLLEAEINMWNKDASIAAIVPLRLAKNLVAQGKAYVETTADAVYTY